MICVGHFYTLFQGAKTSKQKSEKGQNGHKTIPKRYATWSLIQVSFQLLRNVILRMYKCS